MAGLKTSKNEVMSLPIAAFPTESEFNDLKSFLEQSHRPLVLTGAGISTESGIPDYRSEGVGLYARSSNRPVQFQQFLADEKVRRRYWARNFVGWPRFSSVRPNATHLALGRMESRVGSVVTQNVDGLHHKAGSKRVVELHGTAFRVVCLGCNAQIGRHELQQIIQEENPHLRSEAMEIRPDGDVDLPAEAMEMFRAPQCRSCGGILKPDIVFFGDNVPRARVDGVYEELVRCDALLILGSSLQVFSGYRFALAASEQKKPIAIVNIGTTRADHLATLKICRRCGPMFERLVGPPS